MTPKQALREAIDQIHSVRTQIGSPQQRTPDDMARDSALAKAEYLVRGVADDLDDGGSDAVDDHLLTDGGQDSDRQRIADALEELTENQRIQNAVLLQIAHELRDHDDDMTGKGYAGWIEDRVLELTENVDLDKIDLHTLGRR